MTVRPASPFGVRHVQLALMAGSTFIAYALRINLSVAIVAMTDDEKGADTAGSAPVYDWDGVTEGLVLSSFFWGYAVTQIPGGILIQRWGGHRFLYGSVLVASILSALLPPCAYLGGWQAVCANRVLQGLAQGFVFPSTYAMMGKWAPPPERSTMAGIALGAQTLGPVVGTPLAGLLVSAFGWPSVFYSYGAFGALYSLLVWRFGASSPALHKTISPVERNYIEASLGGAVDKGPTPWRHILLSRRVWATVLTMASQGGIHLTFLTEIPTYLGTVLHFDIKSNGLLSALPYALSWLLSFPFAISCDYFIRRGHLSRTAARKTYNSISHVFGAAAILGLGYVTDATASVALLVLAIGVQSASFPGAQANYVDLTPNFAATVFSLGNFLSAALGMLGPLVIGAVVTEEGNVAQWQTVYCLMAGLLFLSNVLFLVFATGETQAWNSPREGPRSGEEGEKEREQADKELELTNHK